MLQASYRRFLVFEARRRCPRDGHGARDFLLRATASWLYTSLIYVPAHVFHSVEQQASTLVVVMHVKTARVGLLSVRAHDGEIAIVVLQTCRLWLDQGKWHLRCGAATWVLDSGGCCGFKPLLELGDRWRGNFSD